MKIFLFILFFLTLLLSNFLIARNQNNNKKFVNVNSLTDSTTAYSDSTIAHDSLSAIDSIKINTKRDSLLPLTVNGFYLSNDFKIETTKEKIYKNDYRYTGNIFSYLPFGFLQDLGSRGQPNEVMIYGNGFGNISFLNNGTPLNNRLLNSFDLNLFSSESIDTLEILPITKGFLYSLNNNSIAVNFITRDKIFNIPYSRIRYYQGGDKEGYIDGIFNLHLFPKINFGFNFTNSSINSKYANSEYSGWKVTATLKYMPSNKFNIITEYRYLHTNAGLNGGVDLQKISDNNLPVETNNILYDPFQAPVNYGEQQKNSPRYQKTSAHNFRLTLLGNWIKSAPTNISFYYQFNQIEFRQNEEKIYKNLPFIFHNNSFYSAGGIFNQFLKSSWFNADFIAVYDQTKYDSPLLKNNETKLTFSAAGSINFLVAGNKIIPSFFGKYLKYSGKNFEGIGAGLLFRLSNNYTLNFSVSQFAKPYSILEEQYLLNKKYKQTINTSQINFAFYNNFIKGSLGYFYYNNNSAPLPVIDDYSDSLKISEIGFYKTEKIIRQGINLNSNINFSKFLISVNASYYFGNNNHKSFPDFTFTGGFYYVDTLFNAHLKLKTGLTFYYAGKQNYFQYDFEKSDQVQLYKPFGINSTKLISNSFTKPTAQLDFFLAGKIKDAAIVYFVFENLLGSQYYIVPYYPKQSRGIRFGVSWELYN